MYKLGFTRDNRDMRLSGRHEGFITMIVVLLLILIGAIALAYMRVVRANR